jgi:hypothetical protein
MKDEYQGILVEHETHLVPLATELEPRAIVEQQVLRIREYRYSAGTSVVPSEGADPSITVHTTMHLVGEPVAPSRVMTGALMFVPEGQEVRPPTYDPGTLRLVMELPLSRLRSIEHTLERVEEAYLRYQEYSTGHVLADIHTKLERVGDG